MNCLNPYYLDGVGKVPCGQCWYCRMMRANQWADRMMHEADCWDSNIFITLTYNDDNIDVGRNLVRKHVTDFLKRVRREISPRKIKYFVAGEYGERYGRPHYHAIIFGLGQCDENIIRRQWYHGFVQVGQVTRKSCRYVAKYITKAPLGISRRKLREQGREPPYQVCSKGLGLSWVISHAEELGDKGISYHGRQICMPRYYIKKLKEQCVSIRITEDVKADGVRRDRERYARLAKQGLVDGEALAEHYREYQAQRAEEVRSRSEQLGLKDTM